MIEAISGEKPKAKQLTLFPDDREELSIMACETIQVRLDSIEFTVPVNGVKAGWDCMCGIFWSWTPFRENVAVKP